MRGRAKCFPLLLLVACGGELRFDDHPVVDAAAFDVSVREATPAPDGSPDTALADASPAPADATAIPDDTAGSDGALCPPGACPFEREGCGAMTCHLECHDGRTCQGSCGAGCTTECEEQSRCATTTGARGRVHCARGASCELTVGDDSDVQCASQSSCQVRCLGKCLVTCAIDAACALACGQDGVLRSVSGGSCPSP
jgi:hypothetical protein